MKRMAIIMALMPCMAFGDGVTGKLTKASCKYNGTNISIVATYSLNTKLYKKIRPPTVLVYALYEKTDSSRITVKDTWSPGFSSDQYDVAKMKTGTWKAKLPVRETGIKGLLAWRVELWFQTIPLDARMSAPVSEMEKQRFGTNWWSTATL